MKPLTRAIVWIWIVMMGVGTVDVAISASRLRPPATAIWWMRPVPQLAFVVVVGVVLILCGLALLRGRRWAWWVIVVSLAVDMARLEAFNSRASSNLVPHNPWHPWSAILSAIFALLVLIALLRDGPPGDASDGRRRLKPLTVLLAWLWIILMAGVAAMFTAGFVSSFMLMRPGPTSDRGGMAVLSMAIAAPCFLAFVLAGVALLRRKAWAWSTLEWMTGLGILGFAVQGKYGSAILGALFLVGLLLDRPRNWVEPPAPEPPEEPTPALPDPEAALFQ
jgi:hypothetical protein